MNDTAAFTTVLEASFASGRAIEVRSVGLVHVRAWEWMIGLVDWGACHM